MAKKQAILLPDFERPPVVEVAVMVQFDAPSIGLPQIVHLWGRIKDEFPGFEQAPPISPAIESFETSKIPTPLVQFQLFDTPPVARIFLKKASDTELIQIQQDRFGYSWRKLKRKDDYPRYSMIRENFEKQLNSLTRFLSDEKMDAMNPTLCEVTYVNHIMGGGVWHGHSELHKVIPSVEPRHSEEFLPLPEDLQFATRYIMKSDEGNNLGRLYVTTEPRLLTADGMPIFLMRLTARGAPQGSGSEGILKMLDLGHEWIVRGFTSLTSTEMHKEWRRVR